MRRHESQPATPDPYWNVDEQIGDGHFDGQPAPIRLQAHVGGEAYTHSRSLPEIVPLITPRGLRSYVLARPYLAIAQLSILVQLYDEPQPSGAVGKVVRSEQVGVRRQPIGKAQAWYYPHDRTLILWEAFLHRTYCREGDPGDPNLHALWRGFERFLLERFPQTQRIATPSWEPIYESERWQAFLTSHGFSRWNERAFGKEVKQ